MLKVLGRITLVCIVTFAMTATSAFADPINPMNNRPQAPVPGPAAGEVDLQTLLDSIFGCLGCIDKNTDQQSAGMWGVNFTPPAVGAILPILQFEYAGFKQDNEFGIWSGSDTNHISTQTIFKGAAGSGTVASIVWLTPDSGFIAGDSNVYTGEFHGIQASSFGFFLHGPGSGDGNIWSVDQLNQGGGPQMLAYNLLPDNRWAFAFEDGIDGDSDHNDFVVSVESIRPVPEPASMILLGSALLAVGALYRRRRAH